MEGILGFNYCMTYRRETGEKRGKLNIGVR